MAWVLWYARYGFNVLDEAYAFLWIENPWPYEVTATHFGFLYMPLDWITGGDVLAMRIMNLVLTFALSAVLVGVLLRRLGAFDPGERVALAASITCVSVAGVLMYSFNAGPPNYNSLAYQGVAVTAAGLLMCMPGGRGGVGAALMIGFGGWVVLMAKPTTASLLALIVLLNLLSMRTGYRHFGLTVATAAGLTIASALVIDGSIRGFLERITAEADAQRSFDAGHTLVDALRLDTPVLSTSGWLTALGIAVASGLAVWWIMVRERRGQSALAVVGLSAIAFVVASGIWDFSSAVDVGTARALYVVAVPLGAFGTAVLWSRRGQGIRDRARWTVLGASMLLLPHAVAFGTNNNYWRSGAGATLFWITALGCLAAGHSERRAFRAALLATAMLVPVAVSLVMNEVRSPYVPQSNQGAAVRTAEVTHRGAELRVPVHVAEYLREVAELGEKAGFSADTPLIDLTGRSPGAALMLGAEPVGRPWIPSGRRNSDAFAVHYLLATDCRTVADAWVIASDAPADAPRQDPRRLSRGLMTVLGGDLQTDYERVGTIDISGTTAQPLDYPDSLYRPTREPVDATATCEDARSGEESQR